MEATTRYALEHEDMERRAERRYMEKVRGKTCGDCRCCENPESDGFRNPERIGFCTAHMVFVDLDEPVWGEDKECESYEG